MKSPRESVLVIGIGNPLRGDDAVGIEAARELRRRGWQAIEMHQLTPELAEPISQAARVIFIDAGAGLAAGEVRVTNVQEGEPSAVDHHGTPGGLLRLAREVYGHAPEAVLIAVGPESLEFGVGLSQSARRGVERAVEEVIRGC
jgi:hydrogenase maturation protease